MKIYVYTMTDDTGFAPAVCEDTLSLACCKPDLRYRVGSNFENSDKTYIIGVCGKALSDRNNICDNIYYPIYIAEISDLLTVKDYFSSAIYRSRPDAVYKFDNNKWYTHKNNPHNETPQNKKWAELICLNKDISYTRGKKNDTNYVLLSKKYIFFGKKIENFFDWPDCFKVISEKIKKSPRCIVNVTSDDIDVIQFENFFSNMMNTEKYHIPENIDGYFLDIKCKGCKNR